MVGEGRRGKGWPGRVPDIDPGHAGEKCQAGGDTRGAVRADAVLPVCVCVCMRARKCYTQSVQATAFVGREGGGRRMVREGRRGEGVARKSTRYRRWSGW